MGKPVLAELGAERFKSARIFRLASVAKDNVKLTPLVRNIVDPSTEV